MLKILESVKIHFKCVVQEMKCRFVHAENVGICRDSFEVCGSENEFHLIHAENFGIFSFVLQSHRAQLVSRYAKASMLSGCVNA